MNILLAAEIKWIENNPNSYNGKLHQQAVIGNITKRYEIAELKRKITQLEAKG